MKRTQKPKNGLALVAVIIVGLILAMIGFGLLKLADFEYSLTYQDVRKMKAFYAAEAGIVHFIANAYQKNFDSIGVTNFEGGIYRVDVFNDDDIVIPHAISTGKFGNEQKRIRVDLSFLAFPYEHAIFGGNASGLDWTLDLRGTGNPVRVYGVPGTTGQVWRGGKDIVNGDVYVDGDISLYEESGIYPKYSENYDIFGDAEATGNVDVYDSAVVSGGQYENAETLLVPDLSEMNYAENNTHNVNQIFSDAGVNSGYLPYGSELRDVFVKNPGNRSNECVSTTGDDYFLEPSSVDSAGSWSSASSTVDVGEGRVYYIDGDLWIHHTSAYGFFLDGKATIVVTGDVHISDNIIYKDPDYDGDLLGIVALGKYNESGDYISGGNVYFGDPRYGTMYEFDGLMFAANDFLYNTDHVSEEGAEPETGFKVKGNFVGLNHVSVNRDWYTPDDGGQSRSAYYIPEMGWVDVLDGTVLSQNEFDSLRHYQMIVDYDERVRDISTQPPGLPRGPGVIFNGITYWEELPPQG